MTSPFSIWVDADSCPVLIRDLIVRFSTRLKINTIFAANRPIPFKKNKYTEMIITEDTKDAADNYIVSHCCKEDLVITRDIPLAARLVEKEVTVINDRGTVYTAENVQERLSVRNFHMQLVEHGIMPEKTGSLGKKEINAFANCFDRELQKKIKKLMRDPVSMPECL